MRQYSIHQTCCSLLLLVLIILINSITAYATSSSSSISETWLVKALPGLSGNLPFKLHTGYIGVGKGEEVQLFYYFIESEHDPESDPLMLWLTGGPGCTGLCATYDEHIGPLSFNYSGIYFNRSTFTWETDLPPLQLNPHSWTKFSSILFLDSPVGTGFSYATTAKSYYAEDILSSQQIYEFIQKWFKVHRRFSTNPFYVGGSSYSGKIVPYVTQEIVNGNEDELGSQINIKGYVLGSPVTDPQKAARIGKIEFSYRASLFSNEIFELIKASCKAPYWNLNAAECVKNIGSADYLLDSLYQDHILEPTSKGSNPSNWCPEFKRKIITNWANNDQVREALHVREGTLDYWMDRCNQSLKSLGLYNSTMVSSVGHHQNLTKMPLRALIYSGDQELTVPPLGTLRWIKKLNLQIYDNWRPWFVNDQVAGYVTDYSNGHYNLTFTTIKGGGHCASAYYPQESFVMFQRWIKNNPL